jgi:hypothetical protein
MHPTTAIAARVRMTFSLILAITEQHLAGTPIQYKVASQFARSHRKVASQFARSHRKGVGEAKMWDNGIQERSIMAHNSLIYQ